MADSGSPDFGKDHELIQQAILTGRKIGAGFRFWSRLAYDEDFFRKILSLHDGTSKLKPVGHVINFDISPMIPEGWRVRKEDQILSRFHGEWMFNQNGICRYISKKQKLGEAINGHDLREDLDGKPVLGSELLDFYLDNPGLIPDAHKRETAFFWGTIYRNPDNNLFVRYLYWNGKYWNGRYYCLDHRFENSDPALIISQTR